LTLQRRLFSSSASCQRPTTQTTTRNLRLENKNPGVFGPGVFITWTFWVYVMSPGRSFERLLTTGITTTNESMSVSSSFTYASYNDFPSCASGFSRNYSKTPVRVRAPDDNGVPPGDMQKQTSMGFRISSSFGPGATCLPGFAGARIPRNP